MFLLITEAAPVQIVHASARALVTVKGDVVHTVFWRPEEVLPGLQPNNRDGSWSNSQRLFSHEEAVAWAFSDAKAWGLPTREGPEAF